MNVTLPIPGELVERFGAEDLGRHAPEPWAAEEYRTGGLSVAALRRMLGFGTSGEVDGVLKARGIVDAFDRAELEAERQARLTFAQPLTPTLFPRAPSGPDAP